MFIPSYANNVNAGTATITANYDTALYNEYNSNYNLTEAYFQDMLPTLYEIRLIEEDKIGIIYFLCQVENAQYIFLNEDAVDILKPMTPDEITNYVMAAQRSKKRQ